MQQLLNQASPTSSVDLSKGGASQVPHSYRADKQWLVVAVGQELSPLPCFGFTGTSVFLNLLWFWIQPLKEISVSLTPLSTNRVWPCEQSSCFLLRWLSQMSIHMLSLYV